MIDQAYPPSPAPQDDRPVFDHREEVELDQLIAQLQRADYSTSLRLRRALATRWPLLIHAIVRARELAERIEACSHSQLHLPARERHARELMCLADVIHDLAYDAWLDVREALETRAAQSGGAQ